MKEDPITFPCDRDCVTHHYACDCREAAHRRRVARLEAALRAVEAYLQAHEQWCLNNGRPREANHVHGLVVGTAAALEPD